MGKNKRSRKQERSEEDEDNTSESRTEMKPVLKGLKLVLKVGGMTSQSEINDSESDSHEVPKKKKKKSRHRSRSKTPPKSPPPVVESVVEEPEAKAEKAPEDADVDLNAADSPDAELQKLEDELNDKRSRGRGAHKDGQSPLFQCLIYLHRVISRKDVHGFFQYPVTDEIAPRYSAIIKHPMDFSTIKKKVELDQYRSINEYKADFKLMCDNAMTYNSAETIYYKEAKKLLLIGLKLLSKDRLLALRRNLEFVSQLTPSELGLIGAEAASFEYRSIDADALLRKKRKNFRRFEAIPDKLTSEEILAQVQEASKCAADKLAVRPIKSRLGFLRRKDDGSTTLSVVHADEDDEKKVGQERVINLGELIGPLKQGTAQLGQFREDIRNMVKAVQALDYGPFGSFGPTHDSRLSNLTTEESKLLLGMYGDELTTAYSHSLTEFAKECDSETQAYVDGLLNFLTKDKHMEVKTKLADERTKNTKPAAKEAPKLDVDALKSLSELGIDVSFLDRCGKALKDYETVQEQLDKTAKLLEDLRRTQHERLSQRPPQHLGAVTGADERETKLAVQVQDNLKTIIQKVQPGDICTIDQIRKALGITVDELSDEELKKLGAAKAEAEIVLD